ncbi:MAG: hypothetical protein R6V00_12685, partial [Candidatus Aminicenantes bacterium]
MLNKFKGFRWSALGLILCLIAVSGCVKKAENGLSFEISFPESIHPDSVTGRVYVMVAENKNREPRFQIGTGGVPFFGKDIQNLDPDIPVGIDESHFGYPLESLSELPPGEYYVQGFVNIYTRFERSDGHVLWLHNDQWE